MAYYFDPKRKMSVYVPMSVDTRSSNRVSPAGTQLVNANTPSNYQTAAPVSSGGGGGGGGNTGGWVNNQWYPDSSSYMTAVEEFQNPTTPDYQESLDLLEGLIPGYQQTATETEANVRGSAKTQRATAEQGFGAQQQSLGTAKDEARRQHAEIAQGLQARYGGSTGTGGFAEGLLGGNTQRVMADLSTRQAQVEDVARIAYQQIEDSANQQVTAAKQWLNEQISGIRQNQSVIQAHKADLAFNAMQQYQNFLNQAALNKRTLQDQLAYQVESAKQQLGLQQATSGSIVANQQQLGPLVGGNPVPNNFSAGTQPAIYSTNVNFNSKTGQYEDEYGNRAYA